MDQSTKRQIRNLILVLFSGTISAVFVVGAMLYLYGPTGQYKVKDALLSPEMSRGLSYDDANPKTGGSSRFIFKGIEFSYYKGKWQKIPVSADSYNQLYQTISKESSILNVPNDVEKLFVTGTPAKLSLLVATESDASWQAVNKDFQQVEFAGDYYRILLREGNTGIHWIYFHKPGIYNQVINLFSGRP